MLKKKEKKVKKMRKNRHKERKNKNTLFKLHKKNKDWKKLVLPLFVFILFVGSSIAFYFSFNPSNTYKPYYVDTVEKILKKSNVEFKEVLPRAKGEFYYIYEITLKNNKKIPFFLTYDKRFFSVLVLTKIGKNESIKEILSYYGQYFPIVPNKFKKIEDNGNYTVYVVDPKEPYYQQWQDIYFLVGNKTILVAQPNPFS